MVSKKAKTTTAKKSIPFAPLTYPFKQLLNKKLKDAEIEVISGGRIKGPSRKTREAIYIERLVLDFPNESSKKLSKFVHYLFGKKLLPRTIDSIRYKAKKEKSKRRLSM